MDFNKLSSIFISVSISCLICISFFSLPAPARVIVTQQQIQQVQAISQAVVKSIDGLPAEALKSAINGYFWAIKHDKVKNASILTVVDFNKPSYQKRLWVINLKTHRIVMKMHVAQGRNSGAVYATRFSNQPGSLESSPGIFTTTTIQYDGEHGISLRVNGLEEGINNNVYERAVVIHPAWYVTPSFIKQNGYAGRSFGCFAVNPAKADQLIHTIKGNSVLFAYAAPEKHDPRVNHKLSPQGKKLYQALVA